MNERQAAIVRADVDAIIARVGGWEALAGEHILITGAAGFLGNYLVRVLVQLNRSGALEAPLSITAAVRSPGSRAHRLCDLEAEPNLSFQVLDLSDIDSPAVQPASYVIHAASHASPRHYGSDPIGTLLPNVVGTARLLDATAPALKKFLFVSSSEVYGSAGGVDPLPESTPGIVDCAAPRSCYAEGKRAGEALCVAWHQQHGTPTLIARPFHTYGPGLAADDGRVFADFVYNAVRREDIQVRGDGLARRAFCYVSDAIAGLFTIMLRGETGRAYNVANPEGELSVRELAELIAALAPQANLNVSYGRSPRPDGYMPSQLQRLAPDVAALSGLGWQALIPPREGFARTLEAHV